MGLKKQQRRSTPVRGTVLLISALLIGSAAVRIGIGAGTAVAESSSNAQPSLSGNATVSQTNSDRLNPAEISPLLEALTQREKRIKEREIALEMRAKALDVAQFEVERRLMALENTEQRLSATLAQARTAAEDDLAQLTTVYENMKPKDASALFGAMEPEFAAGFLGRMRPDVAAKILSGLDPQSAYSISAILAGRNAKAPKS